MHHNRHSFYRQTAFKHFHNNGRSDVIWQIRAYHGVFSAELFLDYFRQIRFHNVRENYFSVVKVCESFFKNGFQTFVNLNRDNFVTPCGKFASENAHSRAYFESAYSFFATALFRNVGADGRVYQKVLSERF